MGNSKYAPRTKSALRMVGYSEDLEDSENVAHKESKPARTQLGEAVEEVPEAAVEFVQPTTPEETRDLIIQKAAELAATYFHKRLLWTRGNNPPDGYFGVGNLKSQIDLNLQRLHTDEPKAWVTQAAQFILGQVTDTTLWEVWDDLKEFQVNAVYRKALTQEVYEATLEALVPLGCCVEKTHKGRRVQVYLPPQTTNNTGIVLGSPVI